MTAEEAIVKDPSEMTPESVERELDLLQRRDDPSDFRRVMALLRRRRALRGTKLEEAAQHPLADPRRTTPL